MSMDKKKTKMHLYTKRYIDTLFHKAIYKTPRVNLIKWSAEDIAQYKLDKNIERFDNVYSIESNEFEPPVKKPKMDETGKNVLKLVLSREGETDTFKSQFKTVDDDKENNKKNVKKSENINKKNNADDENIKNTDNDQENELIITNNDQENENENNENENENNENIDQENNNEIIEISIQDNDVDNEKKNDENNDQDDVVFFDNESSNSSIEPMEIVCDEPLEDVEPSSSSKIGSIQCCDMSKLVEPSKLEEYYYCFDLSHKIPKPSKNTEKKTGVNTSKNSSTQNSVQTKNLALSEIERLYQKYFTKSVQDNIVIIANILNMISMSNKHHKARMDESFKKKTEAEKLKERCDANRMHLRHKKILESKLKKYFVEVISEFVYSEFEPAFQMFFLSILTVLRIVDQPKFKKGSIFKNLVLLLWNSLKNSDLDHAKVFGMFRSKSFRPDCIDLISLIEDSRDNDPGITDRMSLFFVSSVNSEEYFQAVIDAVTGDSNEDLGLLIDNAAFQCCINSKFKGSLEQPSSSAVKKNVIVKTPVTPVPSTSKNDESLPRWVLAKTPSGTFQSISITDAKSKKKTPIIIDPTRATQPLTTNFYEDFSNALSRSTSATVMPKIIVSKGTTFTSTPSVSNGTLQNGSAIVTFKPSSIQTIKSISSANFPRSEGNTIFVGNKQYHVIRSPVNPIRTVTAQNGIVNIAPLPSVKKPEVPVRCFAKSCQNAATIMCSTCRSVKYCSHNCQRLDWYEVHISNCERLNVNRLNRKSPQNSNSSI